MNKAKINIQTMYSIKHQTKRVFEDLDIYIRNKLITDDEKEMFICVLSPMIELFENNIKYKHNLTMDIKQISHPSQSKINEMFIKSNKIESSTTIYEV